MFASAMLGRQKDAYGSWASQAQLLAGLPAALLFGFAAARPGGLALGRLDALGGSPAMFVAIAVSSVIAAALAFAARVGR